MMVGADRALAALMVATLMGATLAFGGLVWWAGPALGALVLALAAALVLRMALAGRVRVLRSPLGALGGLAIGLAAAQLVPLPAGLAGRVSPRSRALHAEAAAGAALEPGKTPVTVDRPATLRWLVGASACLALFCAAAHFADGLGRLRLVWGSVVAGFGLCTVFAAVQLAGGGSGAFYGLYEPGRGPAWAPSLADVRSAPGATRLRFAGGPSGEGRWATAVPARRGGVLGPLPGGPGAYLALASLALPLALGLALQALAPRGSREGLFARMRYEGGLARVALLGLTVLAGSTLAGLLGGPILAAPVALGLALAGLPAALGAGVAWPAATLTAAALVALGLGVRLGEVAGRPAGSDPLADAGRLGEVAQVWRDGVKIARDFPVLGTGLGSFATVYPLYKSRDASPTTALSSLLQWAVEAGGAGLALLGLGAAWCLWRLPRAIGRVGPADRPLLAALLGSAAGFAAFSAVHWTVQLPAVALAACAVGGTLNRWLAGGTDLFVEHGNVRVG
jgi:hypothetical protein